MGTKPRSPQVGHRSKSQAPGTDELRRQIAADAALQEYLRLFHAGRLTQSLRRLRGLAAEAMRFLAKFEPRLVGPVLSGTVTSASAIELHLTADSPADIGFWLQAHSIPYEQADRRLRFGGERHETFPAYLFTADGVAAELCVFDRREARETPLRPVDGKPMKRANLREVENLMNDAGETESRLRREPPKNYSQTRLRPLASTRSGP